MGDQWTLFDEIHKLLARAYQSPDDRASLRRLEVALSSARAQMRALDVSILQPQTSSLQDEMSSNGVILNNIHSQSAAQLQDLLDINKDSAINLVTYTVKQRQFGHGDIVEASVLEFGREYLSMIECFALVVKGSANPALSSETRSLLSYQVESLFSKTQPATDHHVSYFATLVHRINWLSAKINALQDDDVAVQNRTGSQLKLRGLSEDTLRTSVRIFAKVRFALGELTLHMGTLGLLSLSDLPNVLEILQTIVVTDAIWLPLSSAVLAGLQHVSKHRVQLVPDDRNVLQKVASLILDSKKWSIGGVRNMIALQLLSAIKKWSLEDMGLPQELGLVDGVLEKATQFCKPSPFEFMSSALNSMSMDGSGLQELGVNSEFISLTTLVYHLFITEFLKYMGKFVRHLRREAHEIGITQSKDGRTVSDDDKSTSLFGELLRLVINVMRTNADLGAVYWTDRELLKFIKFLADTRMPWPTISSVEFLASIAIGSKCAEYAFNFVRETRWPLSIDSLFRSMDFISSSLASHPEKELRPDEMQLMCKLLSFLSTIIKFSGNVRSSILGLQNLDPVSSLFSLATSRVSIDLKAVALETIASFCIPTVNGETPFIVPTVWKMLEMSQILPIPVGITQSVAHDGIRFDLDQVESQAQVYPATRSFLLLLNALLLQSLPRTVFDLMDNTYLEKTGIQWSKIQETLRKSLHFVMEDVFLKANNRVFAFVDEFWSIMESCLVFFNECVRSLSDTLQSHTSLETTIGATAKATMFGNMPFLATHPGMLIVKRILSGSQITKRLFELLSNGVEKVNQFGPYCPSFYRSVRASLALLLQVLRVQKSVIEISMSVAGGHSDSSLSTLDQLLAFHRRTVADITAYINCHVDESIGLLSLQILLRLSQSAVFISRNKINDTDRLVEIICAEGEGERLISGLCGHLALEEVNFSESTQSKSNMMDILSELFKFQGEIKKSLTMDIKLAILELLTSNCKQLIPGLGHFLLGFSFKTFPTAAQNQPPSWSLLQAIISTIQHNEGSYKHESDSPLREASLRLVYTLASNPLTSLTTLSFLRNTSNFIVDQQQGWKGTAPSSAKARQLFIRQTSLLLELTALELRTCSLYGYRTNAHTIIDCLFAPILSHINSGEGENTHMFDQRLMRIIELLGVVDCQTELDQGKVPKEALELEKFILKGLATNSLQVDETFLRQLVHSGMLNQQISLDTVLESVKHILIKRDEAKSRAANLQFMKAWSQLIQVVFGDDMIDYFKESRLERVSTVLVAVLSKCQMPNSSPDMLEILSFDISSLTASLVAEAKRTMQEQKVSSEVATDFLQQTVLRGILEILCRVDSTLIARGNLYTSLLYYFEFVTQLSKEVHQREQMNASVENHIDLIFGSHAVINMYSDQLVKYLAQDILGGTCHWKAAALSVVEVLLRAEQNSLSFLVKENILQDIVQTIPKADEKIAMSMPNSNSDASYVEMDLLEAKLSVCLCLSGYREGSETLVSWGLLHILSDLKLFAKISQHVQANSDIPNDFANILLSTLSVVCSIVVRSHNQNRIIGGQCLQIMESLRPVITHCSRKSLRPKETELQNVVLVILEVVSIYMEIPSWLESIRERRKVDLPSERERKKL